ncbi:MAG TPA: hypothetical protein ENH15_06505 [Actinobacteria bacterium]|nr:hypothetical protein [Actinomycetota bacterium]
MKRALTATIAMLGLMMATAAPTVGQEDPPTGGRVGVLGCSNTDNVVSGYFDVSDANVMWDGEDIDDPNDDFDGVFMAYRSKSMNEWEDPNNPGWDTFDSELAQFPDTVAIWMQICVGPPSRGHTTEQIDNIITLIRQRTDVPIYASPLDRSPSCLVGSPDLGDEFVDHIVNTGQGFRGPIISPLDDSQMRDNCHANEIGDDIWGADLAAFFDENFVPGPGGGGGDDFLDVPTSNTFYTEIAWLVDNGITLGCDAAGLYYCPDDSVSRAQMASFIDRAFDLADTSEDFFDDDSGNVHEAAINRVAAANITVGCNAAGDSFCPGASVSRGQMASFIERAATGLTPATTDYFVDDDGITHEASINVLAENQITFGCSSADATLYCPWSSVTRGQMAAFLKRTIEPD